MRVTQSMLSNNNLKYISQNYNRLGTLQEQINSGKKITKPSDDPVVAMKGMRYRSQVVEIDQFRRNLNEGFNWLENADSALGETGQVLNRVRELIVQASNDSYDEQSRKSIEKEIGRLQEHIVALANTKVGENYIFNGTNTGSAPINENLFKVEFTSFTDDLKAYKADPTNATSNPDNYVISYKGQSFKYDESTDSYVTNSIEYTAIEYDANGKEKLSKKSGPAATIKIDTTTTPEKLVFTKLEEQKALNGAMIETSLVLGNSDELIVSSIDAVSTNTQYVEMEVMKGVKIPVNIQPKNAFSAEMFSGLESIKKMLLNPDTKGEEITKAIDTVDGYLNGIISTRAELGAQVNRAEMVDNRLLEQRVIAKRTVSNNEDIDLEEALINLTIQESVHRASLAVGARIIQPTLMDFLR